MHWAGECNGVACALRDGHLGLHQSRHALQAGRLAQAGRGVLAHCLPALQERCDSGGRSPRPNDAVASENAKSRRIRHTRLEARQATAVSEWALAFLGPGAVTNTRPATATGF